MKVLLLVFQGANSVEITRSQVRREALQTKQKQKAYKVSE